MTQPEKILKQYFGYDTFRPMQKEIILQIIAQKDVLVLMPTGGGKSICYQVPALMTEGVCVVVSPLISLMKDQVEALRRNNVEADFYNSTQTSSEQTTIEQRCLNGTLKLLYVSPEKLLTNSFLTFLKQLKISLFAIDEAHCISAWGHDFRPEYTQLKILKEMFPAIPVVALTATADKLTRKDIAQQLHLQNPEIFVASFNRQNLSLNVTSGLGRMKKIFQFLQLRPNQSGIIYCLSRKNTEDLALRLQEAGYKAAYYHAGMESGERARVQEAFLKDDILIICATIAFGMGIDKPNVRFVIHYNLPRNVESYYQEIGRGGRDGLPCDTILFFNFQDLKIWRDIIASGEGNETNKQLKFAKLERMEQYAEAQVCRRKMLLSYFHETLEQDCGNCDVCRNPRKTFDGTVLAQKALSALIRMNEEVGMTMLIDVLRGSRNQHLLEKGYDKIKTFGVGKNLSFQEWREYIQQMLNLGVLEIGYDQHFNLKQGLLSKAILFENKKILLTSYESVIQAQQTVEERPKSKTEILQDELFEELITLRKQIADSQGIAPYIIFNDNTLNEMAKVRPLRGRDFLKISGVTEAKFRSYGKSFLKTITDVSVRQFREGANLKGVTYLITYLCYQQGLTPAQIAEERAKTEKKQLSVRTIESHIIHLYEDGYLVDLYRFVSEKEIKEIHQYLQKLTEIPTLTELFEALEQRYDYLKLRIAVLFWKEK